MRKCFLVAPIAIAIVVMVAVTLALASTAAFAQPVPLADATMLAPASDCVPPGPGTAANFAIDGLPLCVGTAEDWFSSNWGQCTGVLLNSPFGAPNPMRFPALFSRDSTSVDGHVKPRDSDLPISACPVAVTGSSSAATSRRRCRGRGRTP